LIVFFLVCASTQPDKGRKQDIPASQQNQQAEQKQEHTEILVTKTGIVLNGAAVRRQRFEVTLGNTFQRQAAGRRPHRRDQDPSGYTLSELDFGDFDGAGCGGQHHDSA
jgi:biopolymer transport protein ExbD